MNYDWYNTLHDIYFFHPINEKIEELIEDALDIDFAIIQLYQILKEWSFDTNSTYQESWFELILALRSKGYEITKDDILLSFYIKSDQDETMQLNIKMLKDAYEIMGYDTNE